MTAVLPAQSGYYLGTPVPTFRPPKAPASRTRVYACWHVSTNAYVHCLPAPVCASAYSGARQETKNANLLAHTRESLEPFLGYPEAILVILRQSPPPVSEL